MDNILPFRRLRWGPPRSLSCPHFLRERRPPRNGLRRYFGFLALVAMMVVAAFVLGSPKGPGSDVPLSGMHARAIDGDTLRVGIERIRLAGIDAPELSQTCRDANGREWSCGREARKLLTRLVSGGNVACAKRGHDRYGRSLAHCSAGNIADLGETLLREGYAVTYRNHSSAYSAAEQEARDARRGIWSGHFERPEDRRQRMNAQI